MEQKAIIKNCKELGCCDACCLRYLGLKNPVAYEKPREFVSKYLECEKDGKVTTEETTQTSVLTTNDNEEPVVIPAKRAKTEDNDVCVSCIGVLQEESWPPCLQMVKEMLDKKSYECETFAGALSAPITTVVREKVVALQLAERVARYDGATVGGGGVTPLKEAWKWSVGGALERHCGKRLESGAVSPLLVTLHLDHEDEARELDALRRLAPESASCARRTRADAGVTRRQVERALERATAPALRAAGLMPAARPPARARPVAVACSHAPIYIGGRYEKLVRSLPQTPWVLRGERLMDSSVQEIIFAPLAKLFGMASGEAEHRLKFMSAGREDVDVRCLGTGRPFAVEVADPSRAPSAGELQRACEEMSRGGEVRVRSLRAVSRERLADLKRGEETKCKTYEALCIKLGPAADDADGEVRVTERDVAACARWAGSLRQRTPLRVLHRRPLLARARRLAAVEARAVPHHPRLIALRLRTDAGTYVKEWAHGDLRRTAPSLADVLGAPADILALDVTEVQLDWP